MNPYDRGYSRDKSFNRASYRENPKSDKFSSSSNKGGEHSFNYPTKAGSYPDYFGGQFVDVKSDEMPSMGSPRQYSRHDAFPRRVSRQHDVIVLAVNAELKTYSQMVVETLNRYAEEKGRVYLKDYFKEQQGQGSKSRPFHYRPPRVLQVALEDEGLIEPYVQDFSHKGCLLAIILSDANRRHGSCTLRILHSDQEHRNMPLADAMELLFNDFSGYLLAEREYLSSIPSHPPPPAAMNDRLSPPGLSHHPPLTVPRSSEVAVPPPHHHYLREGPKQRRSFPPPRRRERDTERRKRRRSSQSSSCSSSRSNRSHHNKRTSSSIYFLPSQSIQNHHRHRQHETSHVELPDPDDPNFLAPSKRMSTLLKMLADSRILSAGELDEITSFVAERKARLNREAKTARGCRNEKPSIMETLRFLVFPHNTNRKASFFNMACSLLLLDMGIGEEDTGICTKLPEDIPVLRKEQYSTSEGTNSNAELKARILQTIYPAGVPDPLEALGGTTSQNHIQQQQQFDLPPATKALLSQFSSSSAIPPLVFSDHSLSNPLLQSFTSTSNLITVPISTPSVPSRRIR
ncbi:hypothetical protein Aperf_G00000124498 [Anoplocephala perfoliata]